MLVTKSKVSCRDYNFVLSAQIADVLMNHPPNQRLLNLGVLPTWQRRQMMQVDLANCKCCKTELLLQMKLQNEQ